MQQKLYYEKSLLQFISSFKKKERPQTTNLHFKQAEKEKKNKLRSKLAEEKMQ